MFSRLVHAILFFYANAVFYALFGVASLCCIPVASLIMLLALPAGQRRRRVICRYVIYGFGRVVLCLPYPAIRILVERPGLWTVNKGCVIVCNHRSAADAFLMAALPRRGISPNVVQMVNLWPMRLPVLSTFAKWGGYLSVRELPQDEFFAQGKTIIEEERGSVIAFPEGTRSGNREMGSFHGAAFRLAQLTHAPIVPVCISGNENIPRKGTARMQPGTIRIRILDALKWDDYQHLSAFQLKQNVRNMMADELREMDEAYA